LGLIPTFSPIGMLDLSVKWALVSKLPRYYGNIEAGRVEIKFGPD